MATNNQLHIDLFNFEDDKFEGSNYVLTSPRSLEACSRLAIKPVELLPKTISEFKEEFLPHRFPIRMIYALYKEHEKERQNKLHLCMEERQKLVREAEKSDGSFGSHISVSLRKEDTMSKESGVDELSSESWEDASDYSSVERARTAWNTSIGHRRVSMEELNHRATELYNAGRNSLPGCGSKSNRSRSKRSNKGIRASKSVIGNTVRTSRRSLSDLENIGLSQVRKGTNLSQSQSLSPKTSRSYRKVAADMSPLMSHGSVGVSSPAQLPSKDQKIISLMAAKIELDRQQRTAAEKAHKNWEMEQRRFSEETRANDLRRQRELFRRRQKEEQEKMAMTTRLLEDEEKKKQERIEALLDSYRSSLESSSKQQLKKLQMQRERQIEEQNKRALVNQRLEMKTLEDVAHRNEVLAKQLDKLGQANEIKTRSEVEHAWKTRQRNKIAEVKHHMKMDEIHRQSIEDQRLLRNSLVSKQIHTDGQLKLLNERRQREIQHKQDELNKKIERSKLKQQAMEQELSVWRENMENYRRLQGDTAEKVAMETASKKSQTAYTMHSRNKKRQQENIRQVVMKEQQWQNEMGAAIMFKQAKIEALQAKRDKMIAESRELAGASQRLREHLKHSSSMNDLDQRSKQVEIENRLLFRDHRYVSRYNPMNSSSVTLG